ncbi:MAG: head GIN domain-containing protein [Pricia sp.]
MKKSGLLAIALLLSGAVLAQKANTKELESFTELKAYDRIIVTLVKGSENKVVITGDEKDEVEIDNDGGLLKIKMEFDEFLQGDEAKATLYYTEALTLIDANENAKIRSDEVVKGDRMDIRAQEGGKIELEIDSDNLYTRAVTGGEVTLTGSVREQEVMVNTGGKAYNKKLATDETTVSVNAGGRADIKASEKVKAKVRAGGSIYVYGNPKSVDSDKLFGGKIEIVD